MLREWFFARKQTMSGEALGETGVQIQPSLLWPLSLASVIFTSALIFLCFTRSGSWYFYKVDTINKPHFTDEQPEVWSKQLS